MKLTSFELFEHIRSGDFTDYDLEIFLKDYSNNYDIELIKSLAYDLKIYILGKRMEMVGTLSEVEIKETIQNFESLKIPLPYTTSDGCGFTYTPPSQGKEDHINFEHPEHRYGIDVFELFFPSELNNLSIFRSKMLKHIKVKESDVSTLKNGLKWTGNQTQLMELIKALVAADVVEGTQKEIIAKMIAFFGIEIKNPDKLIQDIKKRNVGSETLFLTDLQHALSEYLKK